ncbi:hypothetical protein ACTA71_010745 [Dictyostelium dimigraforme]
MIKKDIYGFYKGDGICVFISEKKSWGYIKRQNERGGYRTFEIDLNRETHKMEIYIHSNGGIYNVIWAVSYLRGISIKLESPNVNFDIRLPYIGDTKTLTDRAEDTYSTHREINKKVYKDRK